MTLLPYYYHVGRKQGTEEFPLPSEFPTIPQVIQTCCDVFQEYGRGCSIYPTKSTKNLRRIAPDMLQDQHLPRILSDTRALAYYMIRAHVRWYQFRNDDPKSYRWAFIAGHFGSAKRAAKKNYTRAQGLICTDACFQHMYLMALQRLEDRYVIHYPVDVGPPLRDTAA